MTDSLVSLVISNLLISLAVGVVALAVHRWGRRPSLAHLLWVVVLAKTITPPLVVVPLVVGVQAMAGPRFGAAAGKAGEFAAAGSADLPGGLATALLGHGGTLLLAGWLIGSIAVGAVSARRIWRFDQLLRRSAVAAPPEIQALAAAVTYELSLRASPAIYLSDSNLSPMTWWTGGRVRVILPSALANEMDGRQLRWVLAHELAHVKRRDHFVRWLEWITVVLFWWNPVVWWARRHLHLDEEVACDALVLGHVQGQPRSYARTLLTVAEVVSTPGTSSPSMATGMDSARALEHRLVAIISDGRHSPAPRATRTMMAATAMALLAVGVGLAPDQAPSAVTPSSLAAQLETEPLDDPGARPAVVPSRQTSGATSRARGSASATSFAVTRPVAADGLFIGTPADDTYAGSPADETFVGGAGADQLGGGPGRDVIHGGTGADRIRGGNGNDTLGGGGGPDTLGGGAGDDLISGGSGADVIQGGHGQDTIDAGPGDDTVRTWADGMADRIDCGEGQDKAVVDGADSAVRCEVVVVRDPD